MSSTRSVPSSTKDTAPTWMPIIFGVATDPAGLGIASAAPAPAVTFMNSRRFRSAFMDKDSPREVEVRVKVKSSNSAAERREPLTSDVENVISWRLRHLRAFGPDVDRIQRLTRRHKQPVLLRTAEA